MSHPSALVDTGIFYGGDCLDRLPKPPKRTDPRRCAFLAVMPILALLVLLMPLTAAAAVRVGAAVSVPWMQNVDDFSELTVAVLEDGSFAIASTESLINGYTQQEFVQLQAQFFHPTGGPATTPLILAHLPERVTYGGLGSLGDRYLLVWEDFTRAYATPYSQQGAPLGAPLDWPYSDAVGFVGNYRFSDAPGWRFLPITYEFVGMNEGSNVYQVFLQEARPIGHLAGKPLAWATTDDATIEDAAINGSGRVVVVSEQLSPTVGRAMQIFDAELRPVTPLLTANVPQYDGVNSSGSSVAMDSTGRVLLTWLTGLGQPTGQIVARLYDPLGAPLSDVLMVGSPAAVIAGVWHGLKALNDGSYVQSWITASRINNLRTLFVEHFDPQRGVFEEPVALATGSIFGVSMELNSAGKGVVVWQTDDGIGHFRVITVNE